MSQTPLFSDQSSPAGTVECLGLQFTSDEERRAYFTEKLREKLRDPEFRKIEGFPIGSDEDILALSDPPYYTACPNPFIEDFVRVYGKPYKSGGLYNTEPYAADISEGKGDAVYAAHSYHTKVPHKAIMRYILHYTKPGDIVFDGFCGTGMTGVAAQLCGEPDLDYRIKVEQEWKEAGWGKPSWGERYAILGDLSPAATYICHNYNASLDVNRIKKEWERILREVDTDLKWMYETSHTDGKRGYINYVIWSDVFICPECGSELIFWDVAVDVENGKVRDSFACPRCSTLLKKEMLERVWNTQFDTSIGSLVREVKQSPVVISYTVPSLKGRFEKRPDDSDLELITKIHDAEIKDWFPAYRMPEGDEARRNDPFGITHTHHFYSKRALTCLSAYRAKGLEFWFPFNALTPRATKMHRIAASRIGGEKKGEGGATVGVINGTLYVPSIFAEMNVLEQARERVLTISRALRSYKNRVITLTQSSSFLNIPDNSVDYIFTDPPFGANYMYSELNYLWEGWLRVFTNNVSEAIENKTQGKKLVDYQHIMVACFREFYRILKPGRWMTVEFSNTKAAVWNAIQTALEQAGFVVANVAALDKQQHSFKAITTPTAVKQDLVISCYKPNGGLETRFEQEQGSEIGAWEFIRSHLRYLPTFQSKGGQAIEIVERTARILYDRLVAYFIRHGYAVPFSAQEFQAGLRQRFAERDGMYFLPEQVAEYERKRLNVRAIQQLEIYVTSEDSAIQWIRQQLTNKTQTIAELTPPFMRELNAWPKHERLLELRTLLEENFLSYTGATAIPAQVVTWMKKSSDLRDLIANEVANGTSSEDNGALTTTNSRLLSVARDRWYVPDPNRAIDLEQLRTRSLLKEFATYIEGSRKLKQFRSEAVKAGFKQAWNAKDYETIVRVAERLPETVVQEDPDLLMYYDNASLRVGR